MKLSSYHENRFRQQVEEALATVKKILDITRNPRLPHHDEDKSRHCYEDKYALAAFLTNIALASFMNVLELWGVTAERLETMARWANHDKQSVTMRFEAVQSCDLVNKRGKKVGHTSRTGKGYSVEEIKQQSGHCMGKLHAKTTNLTKKFLFAREKEYHYKVGLFYRMIVFKGSAPTGEGNEMVLQKRESSTILTINGTAAPPFPTSIEHPFIDMDLTWFLEQVCPTTRSCEFQIDRSDPQTCKTPRRNQQVDQAVQFSSSLFKFAQETKHFFQDTVEADILGRHAPTAVSEEQREKKLEPTLLAVSLLSKKLFCPILPLFGNASNITRSEPNSNSSHSPRTLLALSKAINDNSPILLNLGDTMKLLEEQIRSIDEAIKSIRLQYPLGADGGLVSTAEATLVLSCLHAEQLVQHYEDSVDYIESMLRDQLIAAIGKVVDPQDFDAFMKIHQQKFFGKGFAPEIFSYAIRRPGYHPEGILCIESSSPAAVSNGKMYSNDVEPIETFTRQYKAKAVPPIRIALNAATTIEMSGDRYVHGWLRHRFASAEPTTRKCHLRARARQFSCFLIMVGTMAGPDQLEPKHAMILQNKDELLIPLLLEELPTAKEFRDAVSSLSPEQQKFAKAFREMQLESTVFGFCVIQLKPQLEDLLRLPPGSLTKEIQLTQDLLSLFTDYQIPPDLLSYDGTDDYDVSRATKVCAVRNNAKAIMDTIKCIREEQLRISKKEQKQVPQTPQTEVVAMSNSEFSRAKWEFDRKAARLTVSLAAMTIAEAQRDQLQQLSLVALLNLFLLCLPDGYTILG
jgi:hypothetical protein